MYPTPMLAHVLSRDDVRARLQLAARQMSAGVHVVISDLEDTFRAMSVANLIDPRGHLTTTGAGAATALGAALGLPLTTPEQDLVCASALNGTR